MRKHDLFPALNQQKRKLVQLNGMANILGIAGGLNECPKSDLNSCLSLVSDLSEIMLANHKTISEGVTELSIVDRCVQDEGN